MSAVTLFFGVIVPYMAVFIFIVGIIYRVWKWAGAPVPFRIPTTCGQQKSLPWIKSNGLENPSSTVGVIGRMALEVLLFRSLLRNTATELKQGIQKLVYKDSLLLWLAALAFHWSILVILIRHSKLFLEPVPSVIIFSNNLDGILESIMPSWFPPMFPALFITNLVILLALTYLILRRVLDSKIRYISLPADHFVLMLILLVVVSGIFMKFFFKVDVVAVKELALGVITFRPAVPPDGIGLSFYVHLFLVCALFAYLPFSKVMHMAGVFLSPTRNMANTNRIRRHINPWNRRVKVHTYEEYEDEFRDVMKEVGLPLDKE